jgi:3-oxoacyl-[acyl-carrier protein] reductase
VNLDGQVAVVTAGAAGLGLHIARAVAARGARVVIGDIDVDAGRAAVTQIESEGGDATFRVADVTDDEQLDELITAASHVGPFRALVNNAGGWSAGQHQYPDAASAEWTRTLDLNLRAPMVATQLCRASMQASGGGAVVNIASSAALGPDAYGSPEYGAAKAGLIRFTSSVRGLTGLGIRVSCVVPHWIGLPRARAEFDRMPQEEQVRSGGLVDPEVVAATVVALIEDDTSGGRIVAIRPGGSAYPLDPAGIDPRWP